MSESMVERVSEAIFEKIWPAQNWEMDEAVCRAVAAAASRAAIEAMREPTEAMLDALSETGADLREAARSRNHQRGRAHPNATADIEWMPGAWAAAIDAALAEAEKQ